MNMKLSEMRYAEEGIVIEIEETLRKKVAGMGIKVGEKNLPPVDLTRTI